MSYERLAESLIDSQRPLLGRRTVSIAQSVDGLTVTDDGAVTEIRPEARACIERLVERYVDVVGVSAKQQLQAVADEADLVLPPSLGGPDFGTDGNTDDGQSGHPDGPAVTATGADHGEATNIWGTATAATTETSRAADPIDIVTPELDAIYVPVADDTGTATRVPLSQAIVDTAVAETELRRGHLSHPAAYLDADEVVTFVEVDPDRRLSFVVEGHEFSLHQDGRLTVE